MLNRRSWVRYTRLAGSGQVVLAEESPLVPDGMLSPQQWERMTPEQRQNMKQRQRRNPEEWSMTFDQWNACVDHCKLHPKYAQLKQTGRFVSMYGINEHYVKTWTRGTGCSVAILMNPDLALSAKWMASHAWGEDVEECQTAVRKYFNKHAIPSDTPMWFCVFAQYQPEDDEGPSIQEQIGYQPFKAVIKSSNLKAPHGYGMGAIHTMKEDLYGRLWCVHEVDVASRTSDIVVGAAMSDEYEAELRRRFELAQEFRLPKQDCLEAAGISTHTIRAKCGKAGDEEYLFQEILREGGFERLDKVVGEFRMREALPDQLIELQQEVEHTQMEEELESKFRNPAREDVALFVEIIEYGTCQKGVWKGHYRNSSINTFRCTPKHEQDAPWSLGIFGGGSQEAALFLLGQDAIQAFVRLLIEGTEMQKQNAAIALGKVAFKGGGEISCTIEQNGGIGPLVRLACFWTEWNSPTEMGLEAVPDMEAFEDAGSELRATKDVFKLECTCKLHKGDIIAQVDDTRENSEMRDKLKSGGAKKLLIKRERQKDGASHALGSMAQHGDSLIRKIMEHGGEDPLLRLFQEGTDKQHNNADLFFKAKAKGKGKGALDPPRVVPPRVVPPRSVPPR